MVKHSNASKVVVELVQHDNRVELRIQDNGCGFMVDKVDESNTSGLRNIKERVEIVGGHFQISSERDKGTCLMAIFPISGQDEKHDVGLALKTD